MARFPKHNFDYKYFISWQNAQHLIITSGIKKLFLWIKLIPQTCRTIDNKLSIEILAVNNEVP